MVFSFLDDCICVEFILGRLGSMLYPFWHDTRPAVFSVDQNGRSGARTDQSARNKSLRSDQKPLALKQRRSRLDFASHFRKIAWMKPCSPCWTLVFLLSCTLCPLRLFAVSPPIDLPEGF